MARHGSLYERVGGEAWFVALVDRFYDRVQTDPVLRPMYPPDLSGPRQRLAAFLVQRWGGPPVYTTSRGHPRLRMRHFRFPIGITERDVWVSHMAEAVRAGGLEEADEVELMTFFAGTATMVINRASPR